MTTNYMRIIKYRDMPSACRITCYGIARIFYASAGISPYIPMGEKNALKYGSVTAY